MQIDPLDGARMHDYATPHDKLLSRDREFIGFLKRLVYYMILIFAITVATLAPWTSIAERTQATLQDYVDAHHDVTVGPRDCL
jgi:hypothetical protein